MWPFKIRGSRYHGDLSERSPSLLGKHDFTTNDAVINLWLPDELVAALDVISAERDASRPDVLRRAARANPPPGQPQHPHSSRAWKTSSSHLPAKLRRDLERLAALHRQPLSDYLRGVLARTLFGELFLAQLQQRACA